MVIQSAKSDPRNILHIDLNLKWPVGNTEAIQTLQAPSHNSQLPRLMTGMKVDELSNPYAPADSFA